MPDGITNTTTDATTDFGMNAVLPVVPQAANGPSLLIRRLRKTFADVVAVNGLDLEVMRGECFGLLGPNGAGKTTTIEICEGLTFPDDGTVELLGLNWASSANELRQRIGIQLQETQFPDKLTVEETLRLFRSFFRHGISVEESIRTAQLEEKRRSRVGTLSGGQKQRLAMACALVGDPELLFLDEPTTGLDPVSRVAVWEMLGNIKEHRKLTILITTHYMDEADRLCDRIAIVDHGTLVALDAPMALKASVPGSNVIEAQFENAPADWEERLHKLDEVTSVQHEGAGMYRVLTGNGSRTTTQLVEMAVQSGVQVKSLSVQNTTLDDVFVHYTGRQLRDELQKAYGFVMPQRPGLQP
jgi:ABC-2 type transport system ATP-binding protein